MVNVTLKIRPELHSYSLKSTHVLSTRSRRKCTFGGEASDRAE